MTIITPINLATLGLLILGTVLIFCGWWLHRVRGKHDKDSTPNEDLLYTLTHDELANPLQSALATLDIMERRNRSPAGNEVHDISNTDSDGRTDQQSADLRDLRTSLQKLTDTTRNLRELAMLQMKSRARIREKINLVSIAQRLVVDLGPIAAEQSVRLVYEGDDKAIYVLQQEHTVKRVLGNILDNAIKYSIGNENPCVVISVSENRPYAEIIISDNGLGMSADRLKNLGQSPQKPTAQNIGTRGSGIGLYLVYKILEQNDGTIVVESELGKGTVAKIQLPLVNTNSKSPIESAV